MFDPINLDCLTTDADEMDSVAHALKLLAAYAKWKADAMRARAAGDIAYAVALERHLERMYADLPEWAKW